MSIKYTIIHKDILVIGAGGAGLRAVIEAVEQGAEVLLLGKEVLGCAHTGMAMGGMNAAMRKPATPKQHYLDTMAGGWYISDPNLVKTFTDEMPARIYDLEKYGLLFDRTKDGEFYVWKGGKQTESLNVCVGDYTGREMMQALVDRSRKFSIPYMDEFFVIDIYVQEGRVRGAFGIDLRSGEYYYIVATAVILGTGGAGRMYKVTTNAASNTGDGYAMALNAGAKLVDMEMIQFHPTGMVRPEAVRGVLVTEKVRGHGGRLFNAKGERFLERYYPEMMELAGRDEIAKAIYQEVQEGRGTESGGVYLDVTHLPKGEAERQIPDVFEQYMMTGVDIRKTPMEIYPTMHHMCGGVKISVNGETNIKGLYAVGEVTGGIHGANRLGGNSIAEGQVFGRRAGIAASLYVLQTRIKSAVSAKDSANWVEGKIKPVEVALSRKKGVSVYEIEENLKEIMWNEVGINRSKKSLSSARLKVRKLEKQLTNVKIVFNTRKRNKELQDVLEVGNMLTTARVVIEAALLRTESRGGHFRSDYPTQDKKWQKNIIIQQTNNKLKLAVWAVPRLKV